MKKKTSIIQQVTDNSLSRHLLAGLFAGIAGAVLNLGFEIIFRYSTGYSGLEAVSPLILFVGMPLLFLLAGSLFFWMIRHLSHGGTWYELLCAAAVAGTLWACAGIGRNFFSGAEGLCAGITLITGLLAMILVPYLHRHPGLYAEEI